MNNYRAIDLSTLPACCLTCAYGDWDGQGCEVLSEVGYSPHYGDDDFVIGFFHVCDNYEPADWLKEEETP